MAACPAWLDFATHKCPAWLGGEGCEDPTQQEVNAVCAEWSGLSIGIDQLETAGYNTPCFHATAAGPGEVNWAMFCGGRWPEFPPLSAGDCLAWGYSSERCGEMDCHQCIGGGGQCDWGNYFDVISAQPTDYGFKGLWTSAAWIDAPHDLDAVRMSAGCAVEVATESNGGGQSYTFTSDVRVCGNEVGCDLIRSIRVFKQGADDHVCTSCCCCWPCLLLVSNRHGQDQPLRSRTMSQTVTSASLLNSPADNLAGPISNHAGTSR